MIMKLIYRIFLFQYCVIFALTALGQDPASVLTVEESFRGGAVETSGWVLGHDGSNSSGLPFLTVGDGLDSDGSGWLRLNSNGTYQVAYAAYVGDPIAATNKTVYASFEYKMWGPDSSLADGLSFFLFDGSVGFSIGANGGSLGYAQKRNPDHSGVNGGFVGIGFDVFGNYANGTEGRSGGVGFNPNTVSVRGAGQGLNGYTYLMGTADAGVPALTQNMGVSGVSSRPDGSSYFRKVSLILTPTNQLTVFMQFSDNSRMEPLFTADLSDQARPDTFRFGFAATTGANRQYTEIRDVYVTVYDALRWDNESGDSLWMTSLNWLGNVIPEESPLEDVYFDNQAGVSSEQDVDLGGISHKIRTVTLDAPFEYRLYNGTLNFESNVEGISLNSTDFNGAHGHIVDANIISNSLFNINIANTEDFIINGDIDNGGHDIRITGDELEGNIRIYGIISGEGGIYKEDECALYIMDEDETGDNLFEGDVEITQGAIHVVQTPNDTVSRTALGTGDIIIEDGASLYIEQNNQINDHSDVTLNGGTIYLQGIDEYLEE
jgi:hypothetical protein